jgi:hypothetical protein
MDIIGHLKIYVNENIILRYVSIQTYLKVKISFISSQNKIVSMLFPFFLFYQEM